MTPKMQPFWWFLKPPSPACWRNSCENCADWTIDSGLNCSVEGFDYKEGSGKIKFTASPDPPTTARHASIPVSVCDKYFGFWVKPSMPNQNAVAYLQWFKANNDYIGIRISNLNYAPIGRWIMGMINVAGHSNMVALQQFSDDTWYWNEIVAYKGAGEGNYYWYVNGALKWTYSTAPEFGDPAKFELTALDTYYLGTIKLDFIRRATKLEYPPT